MSEAQEKQIKDLERVVFGNGREGLVERVTKMETYQKGTYKAVEGLQKSYKGLHDVMLAHDSKEKASQATKELIAKSLVRASAILGGCATVITLILSYNGTL